jgi:hypothetical protein
VKRKSFLKILIPAIILAMLAAGLLIISNQRQSRNLGKGLAAPERAQLENDFAKNAEAYSAAAAGIKSSSVLSSAELIIFDKSSGQAGYPGENGEVVPLEDENISMALKALYKSVKIAPTRIAIIQEPGHFEIRFISFIKIDRKNYVDLLLIYCENAAEADDGHSSYKVLGGNWYSFEQWYV